MPIFEKTDDFTNLVLAPFRLSIRQRALNNGGLIQESIDPGSASWMARCVELRRIDIDCEQRWWKFRAGV